MRHRKSGRKFGRSSSHRKAMLRNLVDSLIVNNRIETTLYKAKELRIIADRMITLAKKGSLAAKRRALRFLRTKEAFTKLFNEYGEVFKDRNGGYTRIIKTRNRSGDNAQLAYIEYIQEEQTKTTKKKRRRSKKTKTDDKKETKVAVKKEAKETVENTENNNETKKEAKIEADKEVQKKASNLSKENKETKETVENTENNNETKKENQNEDIKTKKTKDKN